MRGSGPRRSLRSAKRWGRWTCGALNLLLQIPAKSRAMPKLTPGKQAQRSRERISRIRAAIAAIDYLCSGTLLKHLTRCGKPGCRCAHDPAARHGPYYDWGHMQSGRLIHRRLSPEPAALLRPAIANYRKLKKLLRGWETETERLIDAETPGSH